MKKHIITALLITTMISMTACGGKNTDATTETVATTETAVTATEETIATEVATQDQIATLPLTDEDNPVVDATPSPDPKASDAPKTTADPKASTKPVVTETTKPSTQASATTTATTKPNATTAPKSTTTPAPKATAAPKATEAPKATPAPTVAPVACQHTNTHVESSHDTYEVPIAGGCYEVWVNATRVCNDCGANLGEAPEKVNEVHTNVVHKQGVSATCTTDGYTQVCGCDCGSQPEVGGDVIPAFGHDYHDVCTDEISEDLMTVKWETVCYICGDVAKTWWE